MVPTQRECCFRRRLLLLLLLCLQPIVIGRRGAKLRELCQAVEVGGVRAGGREREGGGGREGETKKIKKGRGREGETYTQPTDCPPSSFSCMCSGVTVPSTQCARVHQLPRHNEKLKPRAAFTLYSGKDDTTRCSIAVGLCVYVCVYKIWPLWRENNETPT